MSVSPHSIYRERENRIDFLETRVFQRLIGEIVAGKILTGYKGFEILSPLTTERGKKDINS